MRRIVVPLLVALLVNVVGSAPPVNAAGRVLQGSYAFTTARSCTIASQPFVGDNLVIPPNTFISRQHSVLAGTFTFNPDGTGTQVGSVKTMSAPLTPSFPVPNPILGISEFSTPFSYTINDGDEVVLSLGVTTFQTTVGAAAGNTGTSTFSVPDRLQLAGGGSTLLSAPATEIGQEVSYVTPPIGSPVTQYRVCTRSTTATRLR